MTKKETTNEGAAAGSADVDLYANTGRGLSVVFTPVQASELRTNEKNEVFQF